MNAKTYIAPYAEGVLASAWNGGITAVTAFLGSAGAAQIPSLGTTAMNPKQLLATFAGAAALAALMYFKANPIPVANPDDPDLPPNPNPAKTAAGMPQTAAPVTAPQP